MTILLIGVAAFISTLVGGLFALRLKDRLHLILGFSAGAVVAVAFFELIPEAINLAGKAYNLSTVTTIMGLGFAIYLLLDRFITLHSHNGIDTSVSPALPQRGILGASSLSVHSFLDGVAIGLAFQASTEVGLIVATAVLVHDFSDGINTANLILKNGGTIAKARRWIIVDALSPMLGVVSTFFFTLPSSSLGLLLALFAGTFTYIGASDLLPESHHEHPKKLTTFMTILGMLVIYTIIRIAE